MGHPHLDGMNADMPSAEYLIDESLASFARIVATWSSLKSPDILKEKEGCLFYW